MNSAKGINSKSRWHHLSPIVTYCHHLSPVYLVLPADVVYIGRDLILQREERGEKIHCNILINKFLKR